MNNSKRAQTSEQPPKIAAALEYDVENNDAPVVAAFGQGEAAERIVALAHKSGVPVVEDAPLAKLLKQVSVGDEIPEDLYEVVAQVLFFISAAEKKVGS
jgi:flagellar biosynthesis protein